MEKLYLKRSWRIGTCLMVLLTFFALSLSAQNRKVTGVVVDEFGDPLPGANITVVGNQNLATATNMEGQFTLNNVPKDAILNVRFIGYAVKTIRLATLKNNDLLRIVLSEDVKELNDVVVTALGISRESKSLGYARQSIDPNLLNSLSGKVSGVNFISNGGPLSSTRVEIRGNNSLTGNNQPLYVIDGVPIMNPMGEDGDLDYGNPASAVSPDDIESIEVLKGANAAALYGSDAANGVILITTQKKLPRNPDSVFLMATICSLLSCVNFLPIRMFMVRPAFRLSVWVTDSTIMVPTQRTVMLMTPACLMVFLYLTGRIRTNAHGGCRC